MPLKKSIPAKKSGKPAKAKSAPKKAVAKKPVRPVGSTAKKADQVEKPVPEKSRPKTSPKSDLAPERIAAILKILADTYPNVQCALHHRNAWELLVATILSAQCTDVRVNMVTPSLFKKFPTPADFAAAPLPEIETEIRSTGFFHNKAKSISGAAKKLIAEFDGKVPRKMDELLTLPGVARKTANVVLGVAYKEAVGVVVDTHVLRLSMRLGLTRNTAPEKVEQDLMKVIPQNRWIAFSHEMIHHGRQICIARKPRCADCTLEKLCNAPDKTWSTH